MQNINPTKNRNRRALDYVGLGGPFFLAGVISIGLIPLLIYFPAFGTDTIYAMLCLGGLALLGIPGGIAMFRGLTLQKDNTLAYEVGEIMRSFLDNRYTLIRNVSKRRLGYIDAVLVGPAGALVMRIVDYTGEWINERTEWKTRKPNGNLKSAGTSPTRECARDVYALRKYLKKHRLEKVPVYGIVIFHTPPGEIILKANEPVVPVSETRMLYQILSRDYLKEERINIPQIEATIDAIIDG